ncbi:MAG: tetratricopeptide repeat protein [Patescibacteria group bacterium]|nr:tetratricopeptide repeat protein [Patescibacteria group bacterium]
MDKNIRENKALEGFCLSVINWGTYFILFTPLILYSGSFFPFVTPKTIYFRSLVEIVFAAFLILAIFVPRYRPKINLLSISIFIFIGVLVLTSFLGINFERSFWSTYERMTGLFTFFHLLAFFIVLTSVFKKREDWEKILSVSILAGVLMSFYVLTGNEISSRGGGTIGNTSFMATYLLFNVFFAFILFLEKRSSSWRIFSGGSLFILILVLLNSTARGAIISFWAGLLLFLLGYLIFSGKRNLKKIGSFLILTLIISITVLAIYKPPFVENGIERTLKVMNPRLVVWEKGWKGFLEKPIFGWGPENFNVVFTKYFNPCVFLSECGGEIWFDRSHNIVFDTLVATGIVGLLSYSSIFVVSVSGLLWVCIKHKERLFPSLLMLVLLAVYLAQNLLVFDMISSYAMFFLSLGFISFIIYEREDPFLESEHQASNFVLPAAITEGSGRNITYAIVIIPTILLLYFGNIQPLNSAKSTVRMITTSGPLEESIGSYKKALNTFMEKYEIREQFSQKVYRAGFSQGESISILRQAFDLAEEQMQVSIKKNPLDFRPYLFFGRLYFSDYRVSQDIEKLNLAEEIFEKAIELSPTNQQAYWHLAEIKLTRGDYQAASSFFQKAIDLEPRLGRSHWYLAMTYKVAGEYEKAIEKTKDAEEVGYNWRGNPSDLRQVIEIYNILGDDVALVSLYQDILKVNPLDAELWANLAASYANLGEVQKAREAAEKVIEINPDLSPGVEEFLKDL